MSNGAEGLTRIWSAPLRVDRVRAENRTIWTGLSRRKPMRKHRSYPVEFKRQVAQG